MVKYSTETPLSQSLTCHFITAGSQMPYLDNNTNFSLVYFQTTVLVDKIHTIDVNVTGTNISNPYIIDYFLYIPPPGAANSGVETTRMAPSPTITLVPTTISQSTPIGGIVGGIVGGIAGTAILLFIAYYFLIRRPCDPRAECPDKAGADDFPAGNGLSKFQDLKTMHRSHANSRRSHRAILRHNVQPYQPSLHTNDRKGGSCRSTISERAAATPASRLRNMV